MKVKQKYLNGPLKTEAPGLNEIYKFGKNLKFLKEFSSDQTNLQACKNNMLDQIYKDHFRPPATL